MAITGAARKQAGLYYDKGGAVFNADHPDYGAKGDTTVTDNSAPIRAGIVDALSNGVFVVPVAAGSYKCTTTIAVDKPLTFLMHGATITMPTANTPLFNVTSSDVHFRGGKLVGPQYVAQQSNGNAIQFVGASAAAPLTDVSVRGVQIDTWGMHGIFLQYVNDFDISRNKITNIYYGGIGTSSTIRGTVHRNRVRNIVGSPNAYGIYFSRLSTASLTTDPRSADITCSGNVVKDVPVWEGIDTHGGQGITIANNRVSGCSVGILVGPQTDGVNPAFAPLDCNVTGNIIDSGLTTGAAGYGIVFVGAAGTLGASVQWATGNVVGNTVRGHGLQSNSGNGAIYLHDTIGAVVTGNVGIECSPFVVYMSNDNYEFIVANNTAIDPWSTAYSFPGAINIGADYNTGTVHGNTLGVGTKSATFKNVWGVRIGASLTHSLVTVGANRIALATTPYSVGTAGAVDTASHLSPFAIGASGVAIKQHISATTTWDPPSLTAGTQTATTITVTGCALGDTVVVSFSLNLQAMTMTGYVQSANTVAVVLRNGTAGTIDLASGTLRADVWQH